MTDKFVMPSRIVRVEWVDACSDDAGWKSWKKMRKQTPMVVQTVGYVVREDEEFITVAGSVVEADGTLDGDVTIPSGMVRSIVDLK